MQFSPAKPQRKTINLKSGLLGNLSTVEANNPDSCLCSSANELYSDGPLLCDVERTLNISASAIPLACCVLRFFESYNVVLVLQL